MTADAGRSDADEAKGLQAPPLGPGISFRTDRQLRRVCRWAKPCLAIYICAHFVMIILLALFLVQLQHAIGHAAATAMTRALSAAEPVLSEGPQTPAATPWLGFALIAWGVLGLATLWLCWHAVQGGAKGEARTTPRMAVGLFLVPVFNLYWTTVALVGLAKDMRSVARARSGPEVRGPWLWVIVTCGFHPIVLVSIALVDLEMELFHVIAEVGLLALVALHPIGMAQLADDAVRLARHRLATEPRINGGGPILGRGSPVRT